MAHYRTTVVSPATTDVAYRYLADFTSILDWDPSVKEASLLSGEAGELGSRYRVVVGMPVRSIVLEYEIVEAGAPDAPGAPGRVALRAENADVISYDVISFEPSVKGGCEVTYDADLVGRGFRRLFDPFFSIAMSVIGSRAEAGLATALAALPTEAS